MANTTVNKSLMNMRIKSQIGGEMLAKSHKNMSTMKSMHRMTEETVDTMIVVPPDGGWGWVIVVSSFIASFVMDGFWFSYGSFMNPIAETLHVDPNAISLVMALLSGFYYMSGPIVSAIINRFGFRITAIIGGILSTSCILVTSFATNMIMLYIFNGVLLGLSFSFNYVSALLVVGFYFEKYRALATGISVCGSGLGTFVYPILIAWLKSSYDWTVVLKILSAVNGVSILCGITYRPLHPIRVKPDLKYSVNPNTSASVTGDNWYGKMQSYHNSQFPTTEDMTAGYNAILIAANRSIDTPTEDSRGPVGALSQASKISGYVSKRRRCPRCCTCCESKEDQVAASRPMYRDDIFFTASLYHIPQYKQQKSMVKVKTKEARTIDEQAKYHMSVTRVGTQKDYFNETRCTHVSDAVKRVLATMLDFSLLRSPCLLLIIASGFSLQLGVYVPFLYLQPMSVQNGMNETTADLLVPGIGIANTVGRVVFGVCSSFPAVPALLLSWTVPIFGGALMIATAFVTNMYFQFLSCAAFGLVAAANACLRVLIVLDMVGLDKLTNAFGLLLLFQGIASLAGTPIAVAIAASTGTYQWSFVFSGVCIVLSGVFLIPIKCVKRILDKKEQDEN